MSNQFNFDGFNADRARDLAFDIPRSADGRDNQVFHDDGFMHVIHNGISYAYDIGQDVSYADYNRQANDILMDIGVTGRRVTGRNN